MIFLGGTNKHVCEGTVSKCLLTKFGQFREATFERYLIYVDTHPKGTLRGAETGEVGWSRTKDSP